MLFRQISLLLVTLLLLGGCINRSPKAAPEPAPTQQPGTAQAPAAKEPAPAAQPTPQAQQPADTEKTVRARGDQALAAFQKKDLAQIAALAHPTKGIRFSPYSYVHVEPDGDLRFTRDQLTKLDPNKVYDWGVYDGRGNPIELNFPDYVNRFVYQPEFSQTTHVSYNKVLKSGNTQVNIQQAYPDGVFVEYHFPGTKANSEMDWASLRLVFAQEDGQWYLVGVVHDQWTI